MNTNMPVYAIHYSSINGKDAASLSTMIYFIAFALSLIPYVQYAVWLIPLYFLFKEKDSELVRYSAAQCIVIYGLSAVASFIVTLFAAFFATASSGVVFAIINFNSAAFFSILYVAIFLVTTVLVFISMKYSKSYMTYRFKFLNGFVDKLVAL